MTSAAPPAREWSWRRFGGIVWVFAWAGPACGILAAAPPVVALNPTGDLDTGGVWPTLLGAGLFGLLLALPTGMIFAAMARWFSRGGYRDACVAALIVDAGFFGVLWLIKRNTFPNMLLLDAEFVLPVLWSSLIAALACRRLSRRWLDEAKP